MKKGLSDFLSLSSGERMGVMVLVFIIFVLAVVQFIGIFRKVPPASFSDSTFFKTLPVKQVNEGEAVQLADYIPIPTVSDTFELFVFDPNTVSAGDLRRLGLSDRVIKTWLNYRLKGGKFYHEDDISRIYGIPDDIAKRLISHARIENKQAGRPGRKDSDFRKYLIEKKDINAGDSMDFLEIPGIGPVLSGRIIRYRKLLGGYCLLDQLQEVYGLNDSVIPQIAERFYADTAIIQRININTTPEELMRRHPYIGRQIAAGIVSYRNSAGNIVNMQELVTNGIISKAELEKLKYYLCVR